MIGIVGQDDEAVGPKLVYKTLYGLPRQAHVSSDLRYRERSPSHFESSNDLPTGTRHSNVACHQVAARQEGSINTKDFDDEIAERVYALRGLNCHCVSIIPK